MVMEHATSKSAGDEHAAAGEPIRFVSTGFLELTEDRHPPVRATGLSVFPYAGRLDGGLSTSKLRLPRKNDRMSCFSCIQ